MLSVFLVLISSHISFVQCKITFILENSYASLHWFLLFCAYFNTTLSTDPNKFLPIPLQLNSIYYYYTCISKAHNKNLGHFS